ncbi:MAG: sulfate reduction electron transfer complex DsrMKJOP subunit DsrP [Syntrophobacteraceae bacterium]
MLERALSGSATYKKLLGALMILMGLGFAAYLTQWEHGLMITGMGRDVSWGLYISQFTFLVGVAASAVMVVLPYYIHDVKVFGRITVLGEFLAIASVIMCMLFILADMGKPMRVLNVLLYPTPNSILFWDMTVLTGYLLLNVFIGWNVLEAERKGTHYPKWVKPLIYLSIPWAVSIHTVTAFLICGLPGREFWLTAIMAARFLASAFCSGPALLILLALIVRKYTKFDAGKEAINKLLTVVTYAMLISVFFVILEIFTAFYSNIPSHMETLKYMFVGVDGKTALVPFMWMFVILAIAGVALLFHPNIRKNEKILIAACCCVFFSMYLDKGVGLIIGGFIPNMYGQIHQYAPTIPELMITIGIWSTGFFVLTILYKIAVSVKEEVRG